MIPKGWAQSTVGEVFAFQRTVALSRAQLSDGAPCGYIHYGDIHVRWKTHLDLGVHELPSCALELVPSATRIADGDLVLADASEDLDGVGKAVEVRNVGERSVVAGLHTVLMRPKPQTFAPGFAGFLTSMPAFVAQARILAAGLKVFGLSKSSLAKITVFLPPMLEQQAIAEALSDADGLVESLDALIAKKRDLRQAAMESLLARHGVEDFVSIDEVTERSAGFWGKSVRAPGDEEYGVIRAGDISSDGKLIGSAQRFLSLVEVERSEVHEGDVVITASGNGLGKTWCSSGESRLAASNFVRRLRPDTRRVVGKYLAYVLQSREGRKQLQIHTATTAYPNLMLTYFRESWLQLPEIENQLRTAQVLSDMDAEIDALVAQREKAELLKQGMMQELLSGRVRLV